MDLHPDEAYYWQMSRFMDWGYFHQPPMIAVFIKIGYALFANELGVRLVTVVASTIGLLMLFKLSETNDYKTFILIYVGMVLSHAGVFMAVPDSPLIFFTLLFLTLLREYIKKDTIILSLGLGIVSAALMYSKYHSVVLFASVIIALPQLVLRKSFWLTMVVGIALFMPHVLWQFDHDLVSYKYHWLRRNKEGWEPSLVFNYVGTQLILFGPVGLFLLYHIFKKRIVEDFDRVLRFVFFVFIGLFLILSFRGRVEGNWTASAFIALIILGTKALSGASVNRHLKPIAIVTALILITARIYLVTPIAGIGLKLNAPFSGWEEWAKEIRRKADGRPVFFSASYQHASQYSFYSGEQGYHFGPINYDGNQFEIWDIDTIAYEKPIALVLPIGEDPKKAISAEGFNTMYMYDIPSYHSYRNVRFQPAKTEFISKTNQKLTIDVVIANKSNEEISLDKLIAERPIKVMYHHKGKHYPVDAVSCNDCLGVLKNGDSKPLSFTFQAPALPGAYLMRFGFDFALGMPEQNSEFVKLNVLSE